MVLAKYKDQQGRGHFSTRSDLLSLFAQAIAGSIATDSASSDDKVKVGLEEEVPLDRSLNATLDHLHVLKLASQQELQLVDLIAAGSFGKVYKGKPSAAAACMQT